MSDAQKERELAQQTSRVTTNLLVLLDIGLWPGKHSLGIEECKAFVQAIRNDAESKLQSLVPPPPVPAAT